MLAGDCRFQIVDLPRSKRECKTRHHIASQSAI